MADRGDPDVLEIVGGQVGQHLGGDFIVPKRLLVALQSKRMQPSCNVHGRPTKSTKTIGSVLP